MRTCFAYCRAVIDAKGGGHTVLNISKAERAMLLYTLFQTFQDRFTVKPVLSDHSKEDNKVSFQDW